jgi:hypothetical protein
MFKEKTSYNYNTILSFYYYFYLSNLITYNIKAMLSRDWLQLKVIYYY